VANSLQLTQKKNGLRNQAMATVMPERLLLIIPPVDGKVKEVSVLSWNSSFVSEESFLNPGFF